RTSSATSVGAEVAPCRAGLVAEAGFSERSSGRTMRGSEFERGMTYGRAKELTLLIRQLQEPARPTPRIAACPRVGQLADRGQCLFGGGRSVGHYTPSLARQGGGADPKVKKIVRHGPSGRSSTNRHNHHLSSF